MSAMGSWKPRLAVLLVATACRHAAPPSHTPAATPQPPSPAHTVEECEAKTTRAKPTQNGHVSVEGGDGKRHWLYWVKLAAPTQPARGTLFYLAGGPLSHVNYTDLAAAFQRLSFPDFDVVLYDYFGFNCSSAIQDEATLKAQAPNLTMHAMAKDFIQLKRQLVGQGAKAYLMGGSHGAMLGAQIVADFPSEIEKAALFSGDTVSGWLEDGWFRFDRLMLKLDAANPGFADALERLLRSAEEGKLTVPVAEKEVTVDRPTFEAALWLAFSLDSVAQSALPALVKAAGRGERRWIANVMTVARLLPQPPQPTPPPTDVTWGTTFHRCSIWFPRSARARPNATPTRFFHHSAFVQYWNTLCAPVDSLPESPLHAVPQQPTQVPVLTWVGDQDTFDPDVTRAHWAALSSNIAFHLEEGWSHDFGPNPNTGIVAAAALVKTFFAP